MPATLATFAAILKEFYISPILDQLQTEILALDLMEKATVDWNGRVAIMPVHVARNTGVGFRGELGAANVGGAAPIRALPGLRTRNRCSEVRRHWLLHLLHRRGDEETVRRRA